jgi:hypothetical protein
MPQSPLMITPRHDILDPCLQPALAARGMTRQDVRAHQWSATTQRRIPSARSCQESDARLPQQAVRRRDVVLAADRGGQAGWGGYRVRECAPSSELETLQ